MRPQNLMYQYIDKENWHHFNVFPEREIDILNPGSLPKEHYGPEITD